MRQDRSMVGDLAAGYLGGLPSAQAEELAQVNGPGLTALRGYLALGQPVAFLGAGVSQGSGVFRSYPGLCDM
jgi:hypothetical protein